MPKKKKQLSEKNKTKTAAREKKPAIRQFIESPIIRFGWRVGLNEDQFDVEQV